MRYETQLVLAAAYNGTMIQSQWFTEESLPGLVRMEVEDWFFFDSAEAAPFNRERVLKDLNSTRFADLVNGLANTGFRLIPGGDSFQIEPHLWDQFVDECIERWQQEPDSPPLHDWRTQGF